MTSSLQQVRVRFAPSPTGHLHIGSLRVALFNWLFARHNNGVFLLRIEDTDIERSKTEYTASILQALEWVNIASDEPVVYQRALANVHKEFIQKLLAEGKAYKCICKGRQAEDTEEYYSYDGRCRTLTVEEHVPYVVRLKLPDQETIEFHDIVRGTVTFSMDQYDDFIIARSDGNPVYNLAVVIDDISMKITHVIRGEDHISNTPKQIFIYNALGVKPPAFAHLPLILAPSGARLSKRDAATSMLDYRTNGYLMDALCNYLVRLGWAHGDQEIFSRAELINLFSLEAIGKKGAMFDKAKLDWVNAVYMRQQPAQVLVDLIVRDVEPHFITRVGNWNYEQLLGFVELYKERVHTLREMVDELVQLHDLSRALDPADRAAWITPQTVEHLEKTVEVLRASSFSDDALHTQLKDLVKQLGIKFAVLAQPIRLALTHTTASPGIYELLALLGKDESASRIAAFIDLIKD